MVVEDGVVEEEEEEEEKGGCGSRKWVTHVGFLS